MAEPLNADITARRNAPYSKTWPATDPATGEVFDLTDATVTMQVRLRGAQPGAALVDLAEVGTALTEGLLIGDGEITVHIDEATLDLLPEGAAGETVSFVYDMKVAVPGRVAEIWRQGAFNLKHGVTDRLGLRITDSDDYRITDDGSYRVTG